MHKADRAVLRIGTGITLTTLICYGLALPMPHLGLIMAWLVLCQPGEPVGLKKGLAGATLLLGIMASGVWLVPLLTHYALAAVLLVTLLLYLLMQQAMAGKGAPAILLIMAITVIPVAGLIEQALAISLAKMMATGVLVGMLVNRIAYLLFPPNNHRRCDSQTSTSATGTSRTSGAQGRGYCPADLAARAQQPCLLHTGRDENGHPGPTEHRVTCQRGGQSNGIIDAVWRPAGLRAVAWAGNLALPADADATADPDDTMVGTTPVAIGCEPLSALFLEQRLDNGADPVWPSHRRQRHRQGCLARSGNALRPLSAGRWLRLVLYLAARAVVAGRPTP